MDALAPPTRADEAATVALLRRLWRSLPDSHGFRPLKAMTSDWAEAARAQAEHWVDSRVVTAGLQLFQELVESAPRSMKKQADEQSEQWVQRYQRLKTQARYRFVSQANRSLLSLLRVTRTGSLLARKRP